VSVARIVFPFLFAAVLTNCAGQDLTKYALAENSFPKHIERQYINSSAGYASAQVRKVGHKETVTRVAARKFNAPDQKTEPSAETAGVSRKDIDEAGIIRGTEKSDPVTVRHAIGDVTAAIPATLPSHAIAVSPYLDRLVAEDKEDQDLRKKTIICRGC
jgi:hypothetical protein